MDFSFCRLLFFPCFSPLFAHGKLHQICLPLRGEGGGERRRMRCSAPARLCWQMLHFASPTEILSLRYRLSVFLSRRKKNSEKERPLRGFRREVSPDLFRRTEIKLKPGAQCGSAPRAPPGNGCDRWRQRQRGCAQRRKFLYSGQKMFVCAPRGTISTLASP